MYLDAQTTFSDAQAVTSTAISTNVIDLGATPTLRDLGAGEPVYLVVLTDAAATDSGSDATLTVTLESDSTENLATSATVHLSTGALAFAAFSPDKAVLYAGPIPTGSYERYLGVRFTVASGPLTGGAFNAFLTRDISAWRAYPNNYTTA
jgi:hypothetical protein